MYIDAKSQGKNLNRWKTDWYICEYTSNEVLLQFWCEDAMETIKEKLIRIRKDVSRAKDALDNVKRRNKFMRKLALITLVKKPTQELIKRYPQNMNIIEGEIPRQVGMTSVEDFIRSLVKSVQETSNFLICWLECDADRTRCRGFAPQLSKGPTRYSRSFKPRLVSFVYSRGGISEYRALCANNWSWPSWVWTTSSWSWSTRVIVERAPIENWLHLEMLTPLGQSWALKVVTLTITTSIFNSARAFPISKLQRTGEICSRLQQAFHEALACHDTPTFDEVVLGEVSNSRAAFELSQLCLLFLRNSWFANICRCRLRFGLLPGSAQHHLYHFWSWHDDDHSPSLLNGPTLSTKETMSKETLSIHGMHVISTTGIVLISPSDALASCWSNLPLGLRSFQ